MKKIIYICLVCFILLCNLSPAFADSSHYYMAVEANGVSDYWVIGRVLKEDWYDFDVGDYVLLTGNNGIRPYIWINKSGDVYGWSVDDIYSWNGSTWEWVSDPSATFGVSRVDVLYASFDVVYRYNYSWESAGVFFSKIIPPEPFNLQEIMNQAPILQVMTTVGGLVSGQALRIFGILLAILLVIYLVRWWVRLKV